MAKILAPTMPSWPSPCWLALASRRRRTPARRLRPSAAGTKPRDTPEATGVRGRVVAQVEHVTHDRPLLTCPRGQDRATGARVHLFLARWHRLCLRRKADLTHDGRFCTLSARFGKELSRKRSVTLARSSRIGALPVKDARRVSSSVLNSLTARSRVVFDIRQGIVILLHGLAEVFEHLLLARSS